MSKRIRTLSGWKGNAELVQTDSGEYYAVSTVELPIPIFDEKYETMAFKYNIKKDEVKSWGEWACRRYTTSEEAKIGHNELCENLEEHLM